MSQDTPGGHVTNSSGSPLYVPVAQQLQGTSENLNIATSDASGHRENTSSSSAQTRHGDSQRRMRDRNIPDTLEIAAKEANTQGIANKIWNDGHDEHNALHSGQTHAEDNQLLKQVQNTIGILENTMKEAPVNSCGRAVGGHYNFSRVLTGNPVVNAMGPSATMRIPKSELRVCQIKFNCRNIPPQTTTSGNAGIHVANGSCDPIYVRIAQDRLRSFRSFNISVCDVGDGPKLNHSEAVKAGFRRIDHCYAFCFSWQASWFTYIHFLQGLKSSDYATIVNVSGKVICENQELMRNQNVIVTDDIHGDHVVMKARDGRMWRDNEGFLHGGRVCANCKQSFCQDDGHQDTNSTPMSELTMQSEIENVAG